MVLILLMLFMAYSAFVRYQIADQMAERRTAAEAEVKELELQKRLLEQKVEYLSNERGIEAELRRQFDVTLPGEEVVVIIEEEAETEVQPVATTTDKPWYNFWD